MSQTITPGLVDASHWTYVAAAMAESIRKRSMGTTGHVEPIPKGILDAAKDFFRVATESLGNRVPSNPVASAVNYGIATRALRSSAGPHSEEDDNKLLIKYSSILNSLGLDEGDASPSVEDLEQVADFFEQVARLGEAEAYERFANFEEQARLR